MCSTFILYKNSYCDVFNFCGMAANQLITNKIISIDSAANIPIYLSTFLHKLPLQACQMFTYFSMEMDALCLVTRNVTRSRDLLEY